MINKTTRTSEWDQKNWFFFFLSCVSGWLAVQSCSSWCHFSMRHNILVLTHSVVNAGEFFSEPGLTHVQLALSRVSVKLPTLVNVDMTISSFIKWNGHKPHIQYVKSMVIYSDNYGWKCFESYLVFLDHVKKVQ